MGKPADDSEAWKRIARRVLARREALGLTQEEAAERAGLEWRRYQDYERAIVVPGIGNLQRIVEALEMDGGDVFVRRAKGEKR